MKSHDASCFSAVLLKIATLAPNWTVLGFAVSAWGRLAMLHFAPVLPAASFFTAAAAVASNLSHVFGIGLPSSLRMSSFTYMTARDFVNGHERSWLPNCGKMFVS